MATHVLRFPPQQESVSTACVTDDDGRAAVRRLVDALQVLALTRPRAVIAVAAFAARLLVDGSRDDPS